MALSETKRNTSGIFTAVSLLLLLGIGIGVYFVSQRNTGTFDVRNRASGPSGTVSVILDTSSTTRYVGDTFPVKVMVNTGGKVVSGVAFRLFYPFGGTTPELQVLDGDAAAGTQIQSNAQALGLVNQVNSVILEPASNGNVFIDFSAVTASAEGFSTTEPKLLATIMMKANKVKNVTIEHDPQRSQVTDKATSLDILRTIDALGISIVADTQTPAITITSGLTENASTTSAAVTFTWNATEKPDRPSDTTPEIEYVYRFDGGALSAASSAKAVTKTLTHGTHTFEVAARDPKGSNALSAYAKRTFLIDLTPHIDSVSPKSGVGGGVGGAGATIVTVKGRNFGTTKGYISYGLTSGTTKYYYTGSDIISWTDTEVVAKALYTPIPNGKVILVCYKDGAVPYSNEIDFDLQGSLVLYFPLQGRTENFTTFYSSTKERPENSTKVSATLSRTGFTQTFENVTAQWDFDKVAYKAVFTPLSKTGFVNGAADYTISITEGSRLRKRYKSIYLLAGYTTEVSKITTADTVNLADFNSDNKFDIQDFGLMMTKIQGLTNAVTDDNRKYDVNGDGVIDISDISLILSNYKQLEVVGDP